jgi:hypothetical protein
MARFVDQFPPPVEGGADYHLPANAPLRPPLADRLALRGRAFLIGRRLQSGPALAVLLGVTLIFWAALIASAVFLTRLF